MQKLSDSDSGQRPNEEELRALVERIIDSGALGRSRTYANILRYLAECSISGTSPKEMSIALDVLGRDADFDISRDSVVRVNVHHLRNKLSKYFERHGEREPYHLYIPKGQYDLVAAAPRALEEAAADPAPAAKPADGAGEPGARTPAARRPWLPFALGALLALALALNLYQFAADRDAAPAHPLAGFAFWENILDDDVPVIVLLGDYYLFGEMNERGQVNRLVRDFEIDSRQDLDLYVDEDPGWRERFVDVDLHYLPIGAAKALSPLLPLLDKQSGKARIKTMSELRTADLASNHIVYVGLLSGLGNLHDLMFAASGLYIGATFDELYSIENGDYYFTNMYQNSTSGSFMDYGMLSTFASPMGHQFVMLAGMRDAGLVSIVERSVDPVALRAMSEAVALAPNDMLAFEALYRANGLGKTSFDSRLVYSKALDNSVIWEARLVRGGGY